MKLVLDENDLARWPRDRQPKLADFKPEVQAVAHDAKRLLGVVAMFTLSHAPGFQVEIKIPKVVARRAKVKGAK